MRKFLIFAALGAVSAFLLFRLCLIFVPAIDGLLLWPVFRALSGLGVSAKSTTYAVVGFGVAWVLWAVISLVSLQQ